MTDFTIKESILCFLKKGSSATNALEEQDISAHVLQELFTLPTGTSSNLDYAVVYTIFQGLEALGLISRKSDSAASLKYLSWLGFTSFRQKFSQVAQIASNEDELITDIEAHSPLDRFVKEFIYCLLKKRLQRQSYLPKSEYKALKTKYCDCPETSSLPMDAKKRTCLILKHLLIFTGMIERVEDPTKVQMGDEATPSLGLKWTFPHTDELFAESSSKDTTTVLSFNEKEYFEERRRAFQIEFKKEPPKAQT